MSAAPLAALANLESLHLQGDFTNRAALRQLPRLTDLYLVYATKLGDLTFLPPNLMKFGMGRGSVTDISALTALECLQDLSFHKTAMLADLTPLSHTTGLRRLYLAYLNKVTELFGMTELAELTGPDPALPHPPHRPTPRAHRAQPHQPVGVRLAGARTWLVATTPAPAGSPKANHPSGRTRPDGRTRGSRASPRPAVKTNELRLTAADLSCEHEQTRTVLRIPAVSAPTTTSQK